MPVVSNKGLSKFSSTLSIMERKHFLRRLNWGIRFEDLSTYSNKTLDELNPKTVENNPRVVEWNSLENCHTRKGIWGSNP